MTTEINLDKLAKDLAMLDGDPPYNEMSNICWNDAYFANWIKRHYGFPLEKLRRIVEDLNL